MIYKNNESDFIETEIPHKPCRGGMVQLPYLHKYSSCTAPSNTAVPWKSIPDYVPLFNSIVIVPVSF